MKSNRQIGQQAAFPHELVDLARRSHLTSCGVSAEQDRSQFTVLPPSGSRCIQTGAVGQVIVSDEDIKLNSPKVFDAFPDRPKDPEHLYVGPESKEGREHGANVTIVIQNRHPDGPGRG